MCNISVQHILYKRKDNKVTFPILMQSMIQYTYTYSVQELEILL